MSCDDNWYEHIIQTISAVLHKDASVQEFAASFYELDSSIVGPNANLNEIRDILKKAVSLYGKKDVLEIVGCAALTEEKNSLLQTYLENWFLTNNTIPSSPPQEPSPSP
ncbi:MAG: hypothetical protein JNL76_09040 [Alphaproteobacteria bacterium]|nr:hypothetical protein [Alphaproteobacteria bacterium]